MLRQSGVWWVSVVLAFGSSSCSGGDGGSDAQPICAFYEDTDNCFVRLEKEAVACVGTSFSSRGALSSDGLSCESSDKAVQVSFAKPITEGLDASYDIDVRRGDQTCFSYTGAGSASTPASFSSSTLSLQMSSDPANGDLVIQCEGKTFRGTIFQQCKTTKYVPSVGTSYSSSGTSTAIAMFLGQDPVYDCAK